MTASKYDPLKDHALGARVRIRFTKGNTYCTPGECDTVEVSKDGSGWNTKKFPIDQSKTLPFHKVDQYIWALQGAYEFGYQIAQRDMRRAIGLVS